MSEVRRSILFSALDRYFGQALAIATTAVMARLLTPMETGLYLIAFALIGLADNLRLFGIGTFIVQATEVRRDTLRSAFTATFVLSVVLGLGIWASADLFAGLYAKPELAQLLRIAALGFLVSPFGTPTTALLQRDLAFRALAVVNVAAAAAGAGVTIGLAAAGFGAASYMWGFVAQGLTTALVAAAMRPDPGMFVPSLTGLRAVLSFGTVSSAVGLVNMLNDLLPRLIFGKLLGLEALALFGRAQTVCQLPDRVIVSAVQPVVLPAMARRVRGGEGLGGSYLRGFALMSAIQWPALLGLALLADPAVRLLLGSQWTAAVPLVRLIALAGTMLAPAYMTFPVLVASGRIRDTLTASLISLPPTMLIVSVAATFGVEAVAASLLVCAPLQMAVALHFVRRATGVTLAALARAGWRSAVVTCGTLLPPLLLVWRSPTGLALGWTETALAVAMALLAWLGMIRLVNHPLRAEIASSLRLAVGLAGRRLPSPSGRA